MRAHVTKLSNLLSHGWYKFISFKDKSLKLMSSNEEYNLIWYSCILSNKLDQIWKPQECTLCDYYHWHVLSLTLISEFLLVMVMKNVSGFKHCVTTSQKELYTSFSISTVPIVYSLVFHQVFFVFHRHYDCFSRVF